MIENYIILLFWILILVASYKIGILKDVYLKLFVRKKENVDKKIEICADAFRESDHARMILGEMNSAFWTDNNIFSSLKTFLDSGNHVKIIAGPCFDVNSEKILKELIKGINSGNVELFKSESRKNHHIREFIKDGKTKIIFEKPHEPLQRQNEKFLVCVDEKECIDSMNKYFENSLKNAKKIKSEDIINEFKFIKNDKETNKPIKASKEEINELKEFIYGNDNKEKRIDEDLSYTQTNSSLSF